MIVDMEFTFWTSFPGFPAISGLPTVRKINLKNF